MNSYGLYLKFLIQFFLDPVSHMTQSDLSLTQFRSCFQLQVRRTPKTIPGDPEETFNRKILSYKMLIESSLKSRKCAN